MTYTFALNDPSRCTSAILVVPKNCSVGLPRILSSANANGFSSRSNFDLPLGVDVMLGFPRSPGADGTASRARVKLRPSRIMYESGSSSPPRYSRRWLIRAVDVDAFAGVSTSIVEIHEWSTKGGGSVRDPCVSRPEVAGSIRGRVLDRGRTASRVARRNIMTSQCSTRSHDQVAPVTSKSDLEIGEFLGVSTTTVEI